ncbi:MAG: hypothetical protein ACYC8T_22445 [Myxococcaceae bacterium]
MAPFQRALSLRRGNVEARLPKGSSLLLLDAWDVVRSLGDRAVLCAPIAVAAALPGVLRAAREADSVLGVCCPYRPNDREAPARFFDAVCAAAEASRFRGPLFLQGGPIRLGPADAGTPERVADLVFRYIEAGFTLVSIDASRLSSREAARVSAVAAQPAAEAEVSFEVALPRAGGSKPIGDRAGALLLALAGAGAAPRFLRVDAKTLLSAAGGGDPSLALASLGEAAAGSGAVTALEAFANVPADAVRAFARAGLRKLDAAGDFGNAALAGRPPLQRETLTAQAEAAGLPVTDLLALRGEDPADEGAAERIEALSYAYAQEWFEALGTAGSATSSCTFLGEGG